jgi:GNAT superfamily N-acetyltransferase
VGAVARQKPGAASHYSGPPLLATVEEEYRILAAVMMTPPHKLVLTRSPLAGVECVAERLRELGADLPGVLGPKDTADLFAATWTRASGLRAVSAKSMRIYQLDRVTPAPAVPGRMGETTPADLALVVAWVEQFNAAIHEHARNVEGVVRNRIAQREIFLWKAPAPVAMAGFSKPTPSGIRVSHVYTPSEHRRKGYATALVAALSQRLLDSGRKFCFLFTDLANPTSNSIYQKIGYQPVCDFAAHDFARGEA